MNTEDFWASPTAVAWARSVLGDLVPRLEQSTMAISLVPNPDKDGTVGDVRYWVELGASICMGKPILAVVLGKREIPPKLAMVADEVIRLPDGINPAGSEILAEAIKRWANPS